MSENLLINMKDREISLLLDDYLIFTGGNTQVHNEILNSLRILNKKKSLWSTIDENLNNQSIKIGDRSITKKDTNLIEVQSITDLLEQIEVKKGTLMYNYLMSKLDENVVSDVMDDINEYIMVLENTVNKITNSLNANVELGIKGLTFDTIVKKMTSFSINHKIQSTSEVSSIIEIFLKLLEHNVAMGTKFFLIINGVDRYLSEKQYSDFLNKNISLATELERLKVFIFHNNTNTIDMMLPIENYVLVYNNVQQLPPIEYLFESISRNYPDQLSLTEEELNNRISRLLPYVGKKMGSFIPLNDEYMLLLVVLKDLLDDWEPVETSQRKLSKLEQRFLADQKPKIRS